MITARRIARLRALMVPSVRRHDTHMVRLVMCVYVRESHGRTVTLDLAPDSSTWWATERALISLGDEGDAADWRLVFRGKPLRPWRSLAANGVHHGATLKLVPAHAIRRRRTLARPLNVRSLHEALETNRRKQEHKRQR